MALIYKMTCFILILSQSPSQIFGQTHAIEERLVNKTDILAKESFSTLTSCYMKCSGVKNCTSVGFLSDPFTSNPFYCNLLKSVEARGTNMDDGLVRFFAMVAEKGLEKINPPVHGNWSVWSTTSTPCSVTCGVGFQTQTRTCSNPRPQFGGCGCEGEGRRFIQCNEGSCSTCDCSDNFKVCSMGGGCISSANWALRRPCAQPTSFNKRNICNFAVDGLDITKSGTLNQTHQWMRVNLAKKVKIRFIRILLDERAMRKNMYEKLAVQTQLPRQREWTLCKYIGTPTKQLLMVTCNTEIYASLVRLYMSQQTELWIRELGVYEKLD